MGYFLFIRNKCLLLFVLTALGCYVTDTTVSDDIKSQLQENKKEIESIKTSYLENEESSIAKDYNFTEYDKRFSILKDKIDSNTSQITILRDSMKIDGQLEVGSISSDQDIINSLIRIQSKLNIIEDKIFYSDSLYFNLLNDLVIIESQIEDLNQNIDNLTNLSSIATSISQDLDPFDEQESQYTIVNYKEYYDRAIELYMNKDYDESLKAFDDLVKNDNKDALADNAQFWIGQIYYLQKKFNLAINEYEKVSNLGDGNKAADADYKIALSFINLGNNDLAFKHFNYIIEEYPNNLDLISKSKKFIEGNK
ncbi:MAG: hypothetical protein CBD21_04260 [bacterium TMED161]|nr:MAG: hypothetical protein CBD21_04260 [bacterium TMED161]